jgi:hypothetical protein
MLTKTVLCAGPDGGCQLVEVPFNWRHGEPLPSPRREWHFSTTEEAVRALVRRGRMANPVHVEKPEGKPEPAEESTPERGLGR